MYYDFRQNSQYLDHHFKARQTFKFSAGMQEMNQAGDVQLTTLLKDIPVSDDIRQATAFVCTF